MQKPGVVLSLFVLCVPVSAVLAMARPPMEDAAPRPTLHAVAKQVTNAPCAHDVESKLTSIRTLHANVLGFNTGSLIDPSASEHFQGIARYERDGRSYLFVSQSRKGEKPGILATVEMGSRGRSIWGPNRKPILTNRTRTFGAPPKTDRVIAIKTDNGFSDYRHPGGLAVAGDVLAVAMESAHDETANPRGRVDIYRIESPTSLRLFNSVTNVNQAAAAVALTELVSGHYLLAVADNSPKNIRLFRSINPGGLDHDTEFEEITVFSESDLEPGDNNYFQNVGFITACGTGRLYMVLAFQDHDFWGLWRKNRLARYEILGADETPTLRRLGVQKVDCSQPRVRNACSFDASFGAFVSPDGELIYYSSESENSGPGGSANLAELVP